MLGCRLWAVLVTALVLSLSGPGGVRAQDDTAPGAYTVILATVESIVDGTVVLKVSGDDLPGIADMPCWAHMSPPSPTADESGLCAE